MTSLTYTPNQNYNGPDSFTYTIADSAGLTATGTVTITVTPVNDPPTANPDTYTLDLTTGRTLTVRAPGVILNDVDVDGDRLTAVRDTSPANGTLTFNSDGSFTYVSRGIRGPDQFTYHAVDPSGLQATSCLSLSRWSSRCLSCHPSRLRIQIRHLRRHPSPSHYPRPRAGPAP